MLWDNPTVTVTADTKKRIVIPSAAAGDVFTCEESPHGIVLRRVYRPIPKKKLTKAQIRKTIRSWKSLRGLKWDDLRKLTREL